MLYYIAVGLLISGAVLWIACLVEIFTHTHSY